MAMLPETILQFGTGRFLRAFVDYFVHRANLEGQNVGRIVIVQSTGDDAVHQLNAQLGRYHVLVRGLEDGKVVDRAEQVTSISRALAASSQWDDLKELAKSPALRFIVSNTTEAGYKLENGDSCMSYPPKSFPAKLLLLLKERFECGMPGLTIIPCELIEGNATLLLAALEKLIEDWDLSHDLRDWLRHECVWLNTLVDRIVTGAPQGHPILKDDPLAIVGEPFSFWALQSHPKAAPFAMHPAIVRAADVTPYFLRKVRILNAAHTALLIKAKKRNFLIVRDAVNDPELSDWLQELLFEEIVPTLQGRVDGPEQFARHTIERFKNPFLEHRFADIALHHESKVKIRLEPTVAEYREKFAREPKLLTEVLSEGKTI